MTKFNKRNCICMPLRTQNGRRNEELLRELDRLTRERVKQELEYIDALMALKHRDPKID